VDKVEGVKVEKGGRDVVVVDDIQGFGFEEVFLIARWVL
jgi:hypothetical protein